MSANEKVATFYIAFGVNEDGDAESYFFSEHREPVETWVQNGGKRPDDNPPHAPDQASASPPNKPSLSKNKPVDSFQKITRHFLSSMDKIYRVVPSTMMLLPTAEQQELNAKFYKPLKKATTRLLKTEQFEIYECGIEHLRLLMRTRQDLLALRDGRSSLPAMFLMGLVSSYDAFLANLLHLIFLIKPEMLSSSDRNISFKDLVALGSIEAARDQIIEKEVETLLRQSHHAQIDSLESKLSIPLRKDLDIWPSFVEICERRNLVTHTDGVVTRQYLTVCRDHGVDLKDVTAGDRLQITPEYLMRAINIVSELGWKLIQVVWRKLKPDEIEQAAASLNREAYELLIRGRFRLARKMLRFSLDLKKQGTEEVRRMMVVNLAIALKSTAAIEEANNVLTQEDWSATSDKFKICVAAVREEVETVVSYISTISEDHVGKQEYREWPAFKWVRVNPAFISAFEQRFREPFEPDHSSNDVDSVSAAHTSRKEKQPDPT